MINYRKLIIFCFSINVLLSFQMSELIVVPTNYTLNVYTSYAITFNRGYDNTGSIVSPLPNVPAGSQIIITFPNQYDTTVGYTCIFPYNGCYMDGSNLTIKGMFLVDTDVSSFTIIINNVLNPTPAITTDQFMGYIGLQYTQVNPYPNTNYVTLIPAMFSECSLTFSPSYINSSSNLIISITPRNMIPKDDSYIQILMPQNRYWTYDIKKQQFWNSTSSKCVNLTSNILINFNCQLNLTTNKIILSGSNFSQNFQVSISDFISPPTTQQIDLITITSYYLNNQLDTYSTYITGLKPQILNFSISNQSNFIVNQNTTLKFTFTLADYINGNYTFLVIFPSASFYISSLTGSYQASNIIKNGTNLTWSQTLPTSKILNPSFQLNFFFKVYQAPSFIQTLNFTGAILLNGYISQIGSANITNSPSSVSFMINPLVTTINSNTTYQFSITTYDTLSASGMIQIDFPISINLSLSSSCSASGTNLISIPLCTKNGNSIIISNLNSTTMSISPNTFIFNISEIINPSTTETTSNFTITTYYSNSFNSMVALTTGGGITATPGIINSQSASIQSSSYKVLDKAVTYQFRFNITNIFPQNGFIIIGIPIDISVTSSNFNCIVNSISALCMTNFTTNFTFITLNPNISSSLSINQQITIEIQSAFTNPTSTQIISSFTIATYSTNAIIIDQLNSGISLQMTIPASFKSISITSESKYNSALTSYKFEFTQQNSMYSSSLIKIYFPSEVKIESNFSCIDLIGNTLMCSLNQNCISVILSSTILSNITFGVNITNIINALSLKPTNNFGFETKTSNNKYFYSQNLSSINMINTYASSFSFLNYSYSNPYLNSTQTLTLNFIPTHNITGYALFILANSFISNSLSCGSISYSGSCVAVSNTTLNFTGFKNLSLINIVIFGFNSPLIQPTDYSLLSTYDNNGYLIDQSANDIIFSLLCNFPCYTCKINITQCISCYNNINITTSIFYDSVHSSCLSNCLAGYYANTTSFLCIPCSNICLNCSLTSSNCTSCNSSSSNVYLSIILNSGTCVANCSNGYFANISVTPMICSICISPCSSCYNVSNCINCISGYFYYLGTCISACPTNISIADSTLNICQPCSITCGNCSITVNNCTTCSNTAINYNNSCIASCPSPLVNISGICVSCISPCFTCFNTVSNCTMCLSYISNNLLHENTCLTKCPTLYFNYTQNSNCTSCSLLPLNCNDCINSSACATCNSGYVLILSTSLCQSTVPTGYVNISGVAQLCIGDCYTCSITQSNCTSCKQNNLYENSCLVLCPLGYISINLTCVACENPCLTCNISLTNCTSCLSNLTPSVYLSGNICTTICPNTTYGNDSTNPTCIPCVSPCYTCNSATFCLSCNGTNYFYQNKCLTSCPNSLIGINNFCQICRNPCATCSIIVSNCTSCLNTSGLYYSINQCINSSSCPAGTYANHTSLVCEFCDSNCNTCVNTSTNCTSCSSNKYLYINTCISVCLSGYYNFNGNCLICSNICKTCQNSSSLCLSCNTNLNPSVYLNGNQCVIASLCPVGTYANITINTCSSCLSTCFQCISLQNCSICQAGYNLDNFTCINSCTSNKISINSTCISCSSICLTCIINIYICTACNPLNVPSLFLSGNQCLAVCPDYYYPNNMNYTCDACISPCLKCIGINQCLSCVINYYLSNSSCSATCPLGYLGQISTCIQCSFPCLACIDSLTKCTNCFKNNSIIYYLFDNFCSLQCPDKYYAQNNICTLCISPCVNCKSQLLCLTCIITLVQYNFSCIDSCLNGSVSINNICQSCKVGCALCSNIINNCSACIINYYFYQNSCVTSCPRGFYEDNSNQNCTACILPCITCTTLSVNCTSCSIGLLYMNNCINQCPYGYYNNNSVCTRCPKECENCSSLYNCSICSVDYLYYLNYCISTCPSSYAVVINQTCTKCSTVNCTQCTPLDLCYKCINPLLIYLRQCITVCPLNFTTNGTHCVNITVQIILNATISTPKIFPMPFTIGTAIIILVCSISKIQNPDTFIQGGIYGLIGLLEWAVMIILGYLYLQQLNLEINLIVILMLVGFGILYLINIVEILVIVRTFKKDERFKKWVNQRFITKFFYWLTLLLSLMISHKFFNIIFSQLFNFQIFKAKLESLRKFYWFNRISILSSLHTSLQIGVCSYILYNHWNNQNQVFIEVIDAIVVSLLTFLFMVLNLFKRKNFFAKDEVNSQTSLQEEKVKQKQNNSIVINNEELTINKLIDEEKQNEYTVQNQKDIEDRQVEKKYVSQSIQVIPINQMQQSNNQYKNINIDVIKMQNINENNASEIEQQNLKDYLKNQKIKKQVIRIKNIQNKILTKTNNIKMYAFNQNHKKKSISKPKQPIVHINKNDKQKYLIKKVTQKSPSPQKQKKSSLPRNPPKQKKEKNQKKVLNKKTVIKKIKNNSANINYQNLNFQQNERKGEDKNKAFIFKQEELDQSISNESATLNQMKSILKNNEQVPNLIEQIKNNQNIIYFESPKIQQNQLDESGNQNNLQVNASDKRFSKFIIINQMGKQDISDEKDDFDEKFKRPSIPKQSQQVEYYINQESDKNKKFSPIKTKQQGFKKKNNKNISNIQQLKSKRFQKSPNRFKSKLNEAKVNTILEKHKLQETIKNKTTNNKFNIIYKQQEKNDIFRHEVSPKSTKGQLQKIYLNRIKEKKQ